jgi:hypothetical protein
MPTELSENKVCTGAVPRAGNSADVPGAYEQALRVQQSVINPGGTITVSQFFTGYGEIHGSKVVFYPSDDLFNSKQSYVLCDMHVIEGKHVFGAKKRPIDWRGCTFGLLGLSAEPWARSTLFVDTTMGDVPQILTETSNPEPPFKYHLVTNKDVRPGTYSLEFYFTYFNGQAWKSSGKKVDFKVQTVFERYQVPLAVFGLLASILGLGRAWWTVFFQGAVPMVAPPPATCLPADLGSQFSPPCRKRFMLCT